MPQLPEVGLHRPGHDGVQVLGVGPEGWDEPVPGPAHQSLAGLLDPLGQTRARTQHPEHSFPGPGGLNPPWAQGAVPDVRAQVCPEVLEGREGLDEAVGESGGYELDLVGEEEAEEEMAVR